MLLEEHGPRTQAVTKELLASLKAGLDSKIDSPRIIPQCPLSMALPGKAQDPSVGVFSHPAKPQVPFVMSVKSSQVDPRLSQNVTPPMQADPKSKTQGSGLYFDPITPAPTAPTNQSSQVIEDMKNFGFEYVPPGKRPAKQKNLPSKSPREHTTYPVSGNRKLDSHYYSKKAIAKQAEPPRLQGEHYSRQQEQHYQPRNSQMRKEDFYSSTRSSQVYSPQVYKRNKQRPDLQLPSHSPRRQQRYKGKYAYTREYSSELIREPYRVGSSYCHRQIGAVPRPESSRVEYRPNCLSCGRLLLGVYGGECDMCARSRKYSGQEYAGLGASMHSERGGTRSNFYWQGQRRREGSPRLASNGPISPGEALYWR